jgi:hypothetical protein
MFRKSINVLVGCLFAVTVQAALPSEKWPRKVYTPKDEWVDTQASHPLAYYTSDPFLRDDGNDFCISCTPAEKSTIHLQMPSRTEVRFVGKLQGFSVYDVFYYFDQVGDRWKSILVKTKSDQYYEIFHVQPTFANAEFKPSFIFKVRGEKYLGTRDLIPGTGVYFYETYWWFNRKGIIPVDTSPINEAKKAILPKGTGIRKGHGLDMQNSRYRMFVWKDTDANADHTGGSVEINFKLVKGKVIVTKKRYLPPDKTQD